MIKKEKEIGEDGLVVRPNKEQLKRERQEAKNLAKNLIEIPKAKYDELGFTKDLHSALVEGKRITNYNAVKRHISFISKLICKSGYDEILDGYNKISGQYLTSIDRAAQTRGYCDEILVDDGKKVKESLSKLSDLFPNLEIQYIRQLVRNIKKELVKRDKDNQKRIFQGQKVDNKPTKSYKLLYTYLFNLKRPS